MTSAFEQKEIARLHQHFERVLNTLVKQDTTKLTPSAKTMRQKHIESLTKYMQDSNFPRNFDFPDKPVPCFIDSGNRPCAVAHLMMSSGKKQLACKISEMVNYEYVNEIAKLPLSEIGEWVQESGLSLEELALIQPEYMFGEGDWGIPPAFRPSCNYLWEVPAAGGLASFFQKVEFAKIGDEYAPVIEDNDDEDNHRLQICYVEDSENDGQGCESVEQQETEDNTNDDQNR